MFKKRRLLVNYDSDSSSDEESHSEQETHEPIQDKVPETTKENNINDQSRECETSLQTTSDAALVVPKIQTPNDVTQNENEPTNANADVDEPTVSAEEIRKTYFTLFDNANLDPFNPWEMQLQVLSGHPEFYTCVDEDKRKDLYDEWCSAGNNEPLQFTDTEDETDRSSDEDNDTEEYTPTVFHYLAHIVSKSELQPETIYHDIRKQQKSLFKALRIDGSLNKRDQEKFVSRLLYYYKHLTLQDREKIFNHLLSKNKLNDSYQLPSKYNEIPKDSYNIESCLMEIETNKLLIHDQNSDLQKNIQYYILGIKEKLNVLYSLCIGEQ